MFPYEIDPTILFTMIHDHIEAWDFVFEPVKSKTTLKLVHSVDLDALYKFH